MMDLKAYFKENNNLIFAYTFNDNNHNYAKVVEILDKGIRYRYFSIDNDSINEVIEEETLKHLRKTQETNSNVIYGVK